MKAKRCAAPLARLLTVALLAASGAASGAEPPDTRKVLNTTFPADVEAALALSAAPQHLRPGATVYVYGPDGFAKFRDGTNGFTCLVNRDGFFYGAAAFKPTCWDAEGLTSYVPVMLQVGRLLAAGRSIEEIRGDIDAGFRDGRFHRPARTGIAYMLAGDLNLDLATGAITQPSFPGHYMIYAPGVSNADIGYAAEAAKQDRSLPFIFSGGAGGKELAYLITVPHR